MRHLTVAAIVARLVDPASKLATARTLSPETANTMLALKTLNMNNRVIDFLDWRTKQAIAA